MKPFPPRWLIVAGFALACSGQPGGSAERDSVGNVPDTGTTTVADSEPVTPPPGNPPRDSSRPVLPPSISGRDTVLLSMQVADILGSSALVGRRVQVTGTCLGYRVPPVAVGPPPSTRSDWQLESGGVAIYVVGQLPAGCSPTAGSTSTTTIIGTVREDVLPGLGTNPPRARRFMEREGHG